MLCVLVVAVVVFGIALAVLLPIIFHQSAGNSGQVIPKTFVSHSSATGADGRTREVTVLDAEREPAKLGSLHPGEPLIVRGKGFDEGIGIYVSICKIPPQGEKPGPCLGGIPEGAKEGMIDREKLTSAWVTNDWAWRTFATHNWEDGGSFDVTLIVPEPVSGDLDCRKVACAVTTRADHTAMHDRVQDMLLPVRFAAAG